MLSFNTSANSAATAAADIPDGPGVVISGSQTVRINGLPACRMGDTLQEATAVNRAQV